MLSRILETEVMDTREIARDYDSMDHSLANRAFVEDLLAVGGLGNDVVDLGTGTAQIPIELCRQFEDCRIMAVDLSAAMLDLARLNIEIASLTHRIQLDQADLKQLPYANSYFDVVLCNGTLHHLPEPIVALREMVRVARPGALFFVRDLFRPADEETIEDLVSQYAPDANQQQRASFLASFHAALTLEEVRHLIQELGYDPQTVQQTSDRHWTWTTRKPEPAGTAPAD